MTKIIFFCVKNHSLVVPLSPSKPKTRQILIVEVDKRKKDMQSFISNYTDNLPEMHPDRLETQTKELSENNKHKNSKNQLTMIWVKDLEGHLIAKWTLQD
jgi:hypothetical protein